MSDATGSKCFYCGQPKIDHCRRCGAALCDDHAIPGEHGAECYVIADEQPLHGPQGMEEWITETTT